MSDLVRLRASSLPELFDCPARWEAKHVKNMRLPTSAAAQLGLNQRLERFSAACTSTAQRSLL